MGQTEITPEVLTHRIGQLETLVDEVSKLLPDVKAIRDRQDTNTWSAVPSPTGYSGRLRGLLTTTETSLNTSVETMTTMHEELAAYARDMKNLDEGVAARLQAIKTALDAA
ncbi:hypothetical protein EXU48_24175 [Occultella glacieicola]|uniref:Uncharacterized protein n=1 Tax=Occultella glacieicola TaxID=2518684 RepID=A0ABY2DW96_9MICO|nr:hypothetical protein [Occultella glacieicola]TDE88017.1 hypothetical protein EXU48_24175 [Occultella glacieicola]